MNVNNYDPISWKNGKAGMTPLGATNLNNMDNAIIQNRELIRTLENDKMSNSSNPVTNIELNDQTGDLTITFLLGNQITYHTAVNKIAVNFRYDQTQERLILTMDDGTVELIDLSVLVSPQDFTDTATVVFHRIVDAETGNVTIAAIIPDGAITASKLRPDYLSDCQAAVEAAEGYRDDALQALTECQTAESSSRTISTNVERYMNATETMKNTVESDKAAVETMKTAAQGYAQSAATDAAGCTQIKAEVSQIKTGTAADAQEARDSIAVTRDNAEAAANSADEAAASAASILASAQEAESYAHGSTGTREGEDVDNAQYYYQQARAISESFAGALRPMGTVAFSQLPSLAEVTEGDMYNISNEFVTDARFKEGAGYTISPGANVYKTADGYWDVLAGSGYLPLSGGLMTGTITSNASTVLQPNTNGAGYIGTNSKRFGYGYFTNLLTSNIRPFANNSGNIGNSSYRFASAYINQLYGNATSAQSANVATNAWYINTEECQTISDSNVDELYDESRIFAVRLTDEEACIIWFPTYHDADNGDYAGEQLYISDVYIKRRYGSYSENSDNLSWNNWEIIYPINYVDAASTAQTLDLMDNIDYSSDWDTLYSASKITAAFAAKESHPSGDFKGSALFFPTAGSTLEGMILLATSGPELYIRSRYSNGALGDWVQVWTDDYNNIPEDTSKLSISGGTMYGDIKIYNGSTDYGIYPYTDGHGHIGLNTKNFGTGYFKKIYANNKEVPKAKVWTSTTTAASKVIKGDSNREPLTIEIVAKNSSGVPQAVYSYVAVHDGTNAAKINANTAAISSTYGTIAVSTSGITISNKANYILEVWVTGKEYSVE